MKREALLIVLLLLPLAEAKDMYVSDSAFLLNTDRIPIDDSLQTVLATSPVLVNNTYNSPKITNAPFPLTGSLPYEYLAPGAFTDSASEPVRSAATSMSKGEDDEFIVVFNFAQWIRENVRCSPGFMTQNASTLLETRQGSCDEATGLFIALNRASGIPARFVSGIALEASEFEEHAWAEVYFPEVGWVPYDIVRGQLGYVDISHIAFHKGLDRKQIFNGTTISYTKAGEGARLLDEVSIKVFPLYDNVNFSSFNIIEVVVRNLRGYYVADEITIAPSPGLDLEATLIPFYLGPFEERKERFLVQVVENETRFIHSFPIFLYSSKNVSAQTRFRALSSSPVYISGSFPESRTAKREALVADLAIDCLPEKEYYIGETAEVRCIAKNTGNAFIQKLQLCMDSCESFDLGIGKMRELLFEKRLDAGSQKIALTAKNSQISRKYYFYMDALDFPKITIANFSHPGSMEYSEKGFAALVLRKDSSSIPLNASVTLAIDRNIREVLSFNATNRTILFEIRGDSLNEGPNVVSVEVSYFDARGRKYSSRRSGIVTLKNLTFLQKIRFFFRKIAG